MADNRREMHLLNHRIEKLNLKDNDKNETFEEKSPRLKDEQLDKLSHFDSVLCEKFGISKSKIEEHRNELIEVASTVFSSPQSNGKIADTIKIDGADQVHVGHVINITKQIVLNPDKNEFEFNNSKLKDIKNHFTMVDRMHWLAQPSVSETMSLERPVKYVIICQTASTEAVTQAENVLTVRLMQTFHIESQGLADIAYNFCIGSDGNIYEGRGWSVQGSHTMSYNHCSVGIAFIGYFLNKLPPETSLQKCKDLIAHGVRIGVIRPDYELLAQSQCRPFLSPDNRLFREIQTWEHFNPHVDIKNPCKLLQL